MLMEVLDGTTFQGSFGGDGLSPWVFPGRTECPARVSVTLVIQKMRT